MKIRLFNRTASSEMMVGSVVFFHIIGIVINVYLMYRFESSPDILILVICMLGLLVFIDALMIRDKMIARLFMCFSTNEEGLHLYSSFGKKKWSVSWGAICAYGVSGYSLPHMGTAPQIVFVYFTTDAREDGSQKYRGALNRRRICFEYRPDIWVESTKCMPEDMRNNLRILLKERRDGFVRRGEIVEPRE